MKTLIHKYFKRFSGTFLTHDYPKSPVRYSGGVLAKKIPTGISGEVALRGEPSHYKKFNLYSFNQVALV